MRGRECRALLTFEQNGEALLHSVLSLRANCIIIVIGDGMGNNHERVGRHAGDLSHNLGRLGESIGNDGSGGDACFFSCDGIVQTTR